MTEYYAKQNSPEYRIPRLKEEITPLLSLHPEREKIESWLANQKGDRGVKGLQGLKAQLGGQSSEQIAEIPSTQIFEMLRTSRW